MLNQRFMLPSRALLAVVSLAFLSLVPVVHDRGGLAAQNPAPPPGPHEVTVLRDQMVPMRDGVHLATDVYLPSRNGEPLPGQHPTIMLRTPYDKAGGSNTPNFYASHGFAVVVQDVRGRFKSEGEWIRFVDDPDDGYDTGEWLARQPWSTGQFGMTGCSYVGGTQHVMAMTQPTVPGLRTVIPEDATSNEAIQNRWNFGAFEGRNLNWIFTNGPASAMARNPELVPMLEEMRDNRLDYIRMQPIRKGTTPLKHIPEYEEWLIGAMTSPRANDPFWKMLRIRDEYGPYSEAHLYKEMPIYLVGGWYDSKPGHTTENFRVLRRQSQAPMYMIMGPWIHCNRGTRHGQVEFGPEAAISQLEYNLLWFNHVLKGDETVVGRADPFATPVRLFIMGTGDGHKTEDGLLFHGGYWRNENEWPLARARMTPYYLHEDGTLSDAAPPAESSSTTYDYNPGDPVPSIGGNVSSAGGIMLQGAWDQRGGPHIWNFQEPLPLSHRNDVVVFQTEPLEEDLEVTGDIQVRLWVSSSAVDTDFTAKLIDVYPSSDDFPGGFDLLINDGILRTRFRENLWEEKLMQPGDVHELLITLYPTSNVFKRGHRIRVDISSSNFPRFLPNPNTGEPIGRERMSQGARNTIYHDRARPSHIILPIIPGGGEGGR